MASAPIISNDLLLIFSGVIGIILYRVYLSGLKKIRVICFFLWKNGSMDKYKAEEEIKSNNLTVIKSRKDKITLNREGQPVEYREGPTKRLRAYFAMEGTLATINLTSEIKQALTGESGEGRFANILIPKVGQFAEELGAPFKIGMKTQLPIILLSMASGIGLWMALERILQF